jgi:hypothetical protein
MDAPPPTISERLTTAILDLNDKEPERFGEEADPRSAAGFFLAKHHPECFDLSNPVDRLLLELTAMDGEED